MEYLLCARPQLSLGPKDTSHQAPVLQMSGPRTVGVLTGDNNYRAVPSSVASVISCSTPTLLKRKLASEPPKFPHAEEEAGLGQSLGTVPRSDWVSCRPRSEAHAPTL